MMPEIDGISLCRKIRAANFSEYIYIILLTAKNQKSEIIEGLEAGADDYIIKPFHPEELLARIRSGRRVIDLEDKNREAQSKSMQAEKLVSIGQLAAGIAHEIKISFYLHSIEDTLDDAQCVLDISGTDLIMDHRPYPLLIHWNRQYPHTFFVQFFSQCRCGQAFFFN